MGVNPGPVVAWKRVFQRLGLLTQFSNTMEHATVYGHRISR